MLAPRAKASCIWEPDPSLRPPGQARGEAIQRTSGPYVPLDCFVANAPRNDDSTSEQLFLKPTRRPNLRRAHRLRQPIENHYALAAAAGRKRFGRVGVAA